MALIDLRIENPAKRKGTYHCFCKNMQAKNGTAVAQNYKFIDGKYHCADWVSLSTILSVVALVIAGTIGIINVSVEIFIGYGSELISRPVNHERVILETMAGICGI